MDAEKLLLLERAAKDLMVSALASLRKCFKGRGSVSSSAMAKGFPLLYLLIEGGI